LTLEVNPFIDQKETEKILKMRSLLWNSLKEWNAMYDKRSTISFTEIKVGEFQEPLAKYRGICSLLEKEIIKNAVLSHLKGKVDQIGIIMPIISALKNEYLKEWHWAEIKQLLGNDLKLAD